MSANKFQIYLKYQDLVSEFFSRQNLHCRAFSSIIIYKHLRRFDRILKQSRKLMNKAEKTKPSRLTLMFGTITIFCSNCASVRECSCLTIEHIRSTYGLIIIRTESTALWFWFWFWLRFWIVATPSSICSSEFCVTLFDQIKIP